MALGGGTYRCDCQDGYGGALCNLRVAPTTTVGSSVCGGGGSGSGAFQCLHGRCEQMEAGGGRCVCEPGFSGESCSIGEEGGTLTVAGCNDQLTQWVKPTEYRMYSVSAFYTH